VIPLIQIKALNINSNKGFKEIERKKPLTISKRNGVS
jgi:hypothetical protein